MYIDEDRNINLDQYTDMKEVIGKGQEEGIRI